MANINISTSQEEEASTLTGDELVRLVQGGQDKRKTTREIAATIGMPKTIDVTVYQTSQDDDKCTLSFTSDTDIDLIIPFGLSLGFGLNFVEMGLGSVIPSAAVGVTINSSQNFVRTASQYSFMRLVAVGQDNYVLTGDGATEGT